MKKSKKPIGIFIDCNGQLNEYFGDSQSHRAVECMGFVMIEVIGKFGEVIDQCVLYQAIKNIKNLKEF